MPLYRNRQLSQLSKLRLILGAAVALVLIGQTEGLEKLGQKLG